MSNSSSAMARETAEAPDAVSRLIDREWRAIRALGRKLSANPPHVVVTAARGSSDNAAGFLKYAVEIATGVPVASMGPSVASIYHAPLRLEGALLVTISQSGESPDLVVLQEAAKKAGAATLALVNDEASPVAKGADHVLSLHAGQETSVAATKSFVASTAAVAALVAAWSGDEALAAAVRLLPKALHEALSLDWSAALPAFEGAASLYALGRGPAFPIAQEAALKFKEVAGIHAEAFSSAEVMHGPLRLVEGRLPILFFAPHDAALATNREAAAKLAAMEASVFCVAPRAGDGMPGTRLPAASTGHAAIDPIVMILSFYRFVEMLARLRGLDPDRPSYLTKVTRTL